jgi:hypothetical protein
MIRRSVFAIALIVIWLAVCLIAVGIPWSAPWSPSAQLTIGGRNLLMRSGKGNHDAEGLIVSALGDDNTALQTATLGRLRSEQTPILRYHIRDFPRTLELALVFRQTDAPDDVQTISLPAPVSPESAVDLSMLPNWRGEIIEIGFAEYPVAQVVPPSRAKFSPFRIDGVKLQSRSWSEIVPRLASDWFGYRPWALLSISALGPEIATFPTSSFVASIGAGMMLSLFAAQVIFRWKARRFVVVAAATACCAWFVLDLRWLGDLIGKHVVVETLYADKPWSERALIQPDEDTVDAARRFREFAARQSGSEQDLRTFVLSDSTFTQLRLIYFLWPLNIAPMFDTADADVALPPEALIVLFQSDAKFDAQEGTLEAAGRKFPVTQLYDEKELRIFRSRGVAR